MHISAVVEQIKSRYRSLGPVMDERVRRQWAATEAQTYGWGGLSAVSEATGMSRNTVRKGIAELKLRKKSRQAAVGTRLRRKGGGRKCLTETDTGLLDALKLLVEPATCGDPMSALRWTCKSTARLAEELTRHSHPIGAWTVGALLRADSFSLQSNRKTREGTKHPDRNA